MKCPVCSFPDTKVIDSRKTEDQSSIRRRRQCEACGKRFTTFEIIERSPLSVVKKTVPESRIPGRKYCPG